jgi:hypothetical protein
MKTFGQFVDIHLQVLIFSSILYGVGIGLKNLRHLRSHCVWNSHVLPALPYAYAFPETVAYAFPETYIYIYTKVTRNNFLTCNQDKPVVLTKTSA